MSVFKKDYPLSGDLPFTGHVRVSILDKLVPREVFQIFSAITRAGT